MADLDKRVERFLEREFDKTKDELFYIEGRDWSDIPPKGAKVRYNMHKDVIKRAISNLREVKELTSSDFSHPRVKDYIETCIKFYELAGQWYRERTTKRAWTAMDDDPKGQAEEFKFQGDVHEDIKSIEKDLDKLELSSTVTVTLNLHKSTEFLPFPLIFKYYKEKPRIAELLKQKLSRKYIKYIETQG